MFAYHHLYLRWRSQCSFRDRRSFNSRETEHQLSSREHLHSWLKTKIRNVIVLILITCHINKKTRIGHMSIIICFYPSTYSSISMRVTFNFLLISFLMPWISPFLQWSSHSESSLARSSNILTAYPFYSDHPMTTAPQKGYHLLTQQRSHPFIPLSPAYSFSENRQISHFSRYIIARDIPSLFSRPRHPISHSSSPYEQPKNSNQAPPLIAGRWRKRHRSGTSRPGRCCRVSIFGLEVLLLSGFSYWALGLGLQNFALYGLWSLGARKL